MNKRYRLKVYLPYSTDYELLTIESDFPFASFQAGNLLDLTAFSNIASLPNVPILLKIVGVEHLLKDEVGEVYHTLSLYTEEVTDGSEARLGYNGHIER